MNVAEAIQLVLSISKYYKMSRPYIVGGIPRDISMGLDIETRDIDITTNNSEALRLGILVSDKLNRVFEIAEDGHATIFTSDFDLDFSSNFISPAVERKLNGIEKNKLEAFSRDFTMNTLMQDMETKKIWDPTGMGLNDIKNRVIRTPVDPSITFEDDPRRIYRAIELAVRYEFSIDSKIQEYAILNSEKFSPKFIKENYISTKIAKALGNNPDLTIEYLKDFGLFGYVPLVGEFKSTLINKKLIMDYLNEQDNKKS